MNPPDAYVAEYGDKSFDGDSKQFYDLVSGGEAHGYKIADVYVKFRDGKVMKLSDITEDTARAWVMQIPDVLPDVHIDKFGTRDGRMLTEYKVDSVNWLAFDDGKLAWCGIKGNALDDSPLARIQVAPRREGEFLTFPIKRNDLFRVFGEPKEIREIRHQMRP